jgi:hypothetical protein
VNIEFHQAFVSHFQQEGLASLLIYDIGAFHDFVDNGMGSSNRYAALREGALWLRRLTADFTVMANSSTV